jgi:hypothetical protein
MASCWQHKGINLPTERKAKMRRSQWLKWAPGLLATLLADHLHAAPIKLLGLDDMSCQTWLNSKSELEERQIYIAWARGFLSGHNYANQRQQVTDVSSGTIATFADRFCRENSKASFADAIYHMSDEFSGRGAPIAK